MAKLAATVAVASPVLSGAAVGCHHEQQHQELLLTDILHLFAQIPLHSAYRDPSPVAMETADLPALSFTEFDEAIVEIGHGSTGFAFDSEGPRRRALIEPLPKFSFLVIRDGSFRA